MRLPTSEVIKEIGKDWCSCCHLDRIQVLIHNRFLTRPLPLFPNSTLDFRRPLRLSAMPPFSNYALRPSTLDFYTHPNNLELAQISDQRTKFSMYTHGWPPMMMWRPSFIRSFVCYATPYTPPPPSFHYRKPPSQPFCIKPIQYSAGWRAHFHHF